MGIHGNGGDAAEFLHLMDHKGDDGKIKPSGGRIEMQGQFSPWCNADMEFELREIDTDPFGFLIHDSSLGIAG